MADTRPTLLRGPDGAMYFIPREQLEQFLVPDDQAAEVERNIRSLQEEGEVSGFAFDNPISPSSLGLTNPVAPTMDDSPTVVDGSGRQMPSSNW